MQEHFELVVVPKETKNFCLKRPDIVLIDKNELVQQFQNF